MHVVGEELDPIRKLRVGDHTPSYWVPLGEMPVVVNGHELVAELVQLKL